jgi:hypothetical protein
MMLALARVPALRLLRTPRAWLPVVGWALLAVVSALGARSHGATNGADHLMRGALGVLVLPLACYAIVAGVVGGAGLRGGLRGVVSLGAAPRTAALASVLVAVGAAAAVGALLAAVACGLAHGAHDPPLAGDLFTSLWVGALGGGAYGAYFSAGSAIGKGLVMRGAFLAFDWIVGAGGGFGALFTPRGHVLSLLGGPLCAEVSQRASSALLLVVIGLYVTLALLLTRRA